MIQCDKVIKVEIPKLTYRPKATSISYIEVQREAGYTAKYFHSHDHHEISLITSSCTCQATNNGTSVSFQAPALILMKAGSFHEIAHVLDGHFSSRNLFFHPQLVSDIPQRLHHTEQLFGNEGLILPLTQTQLDEFLPIFDLAKDRNFPENLLLLLSVLCHLQALLDSGNVPLLIASQKSFVFDIIEMIQKHPERKYAIAELSEQFHISQTKLKADFKRIVGMSVNTFCRQARLQKSLVLMESTEMSQAQIAFACGFSDESHFIGAFRDHYALTPGAFRRQIKNLS